MALMDLARKQAERLADVAVWARKIRETLGPTLEANRGKVHFRPTSSGATMVGLAQKTPQRGKGGFKDLERLARDFDPLFAEHCGDLPGRSTPEKELQSFLIAEAYQSGRRLASINAASARTNAPVELLFVTDEIPLPVEGEKNIVCDILALRTDSNLCTPVLLELKSERMMKRLVDQVRDYSALIDEHRGEFEKLFEAVLGRPVQFDDAPTEKWIVWPFPKSGPETRERELANEQIRLVDYREVEGGYEFSAGNAGLPA